MDLHNLEMRILTLLHNGLNVRPTVETARQIGELLLQGKASLEHGQYIPWLRRIGLARQTAQTYTQIAKAEVDIGNDQRSGHLTIDGVLRRIRSGRQVERRKHAKSLRDGAVDSDLDPGMICGDSLTWLRERPDNSVPLFISDPPYGMGTTFDGWTDPDNPADYWKWLAPFWDEMTRVVQPGGVVILWQAYRHLPHLMNWFPGCIIIASCFTIRGVRQWEPIVKWVKPGADPLIREGAWNDWMDASAWYRGESGDYKSVHPCPKPLNDCREIVRRYTVAGKLVVDCFAGVGTIPLACKMEGRDYIGIERSKAFAGIGAKRLHDTK